MTGSLSDPNTLAKARATREANKIAEQDYIDRNRTALPDGATLEPDSSPGVGWKVMPPPRYDGDRPDPKYYGTRESALRYYHPELTKEWELFLSTK